RFAFDKADLPAEGVRFLQEFTPKFAGAVCRDEVKTTIASILVEGHADNVGSDKANLERSQQRASAVTNESLEILKQTDGPYLGDCFKDLVSASGRGNAEPMRDSNGRSDRERSRRVVFKIRIRSLEQELVRTIGRSPNVPGSGR